MEWLPTLPQGNRLAQLCQLCTVSLFGVALTGTRSEVEGGQSPLPWLRSLSELQPAE